MLDVFTRVKLLFEKDRDKDFRAELTGILGFLPHKIELYKIAFSHSSNQYRSPKGGKRLNNERLEFLGDAILEAVVSDLVFHHFENKREGFLTNTRSKMVQRSTLNELATEMGIDRLIKTGSRGQAHNSNIGGNAFEALIGAIYLDRGYRACKKFVEKQILRKFVNIDDVAQREVNFKSKILEYCQKNRISCEFKLKNVDKAEANSPVFRTILDIEGVMVGEGKGYSKKESEQKACRDALLRMRRSQALVAQVFEAKESRTSTEAPVFVAVPRIEEIEEEIAKMGEEKTERRRQQRQRQKERKETAAATKRESSTTSENVGTSENEKQKNSGFSPKTDSPEPSEKIKKPRASRRRPSSDTAPLQPPPPPPPAETPAIPAPLFMLSDLPKTEPKAEEKTSTKPRRGRRKPKTETAESQTNKKKEKKLSDEKDANNEPKAEPEKKPRRTTRRRKAATAEDSTKKSKALNNTENPTLPFAPQEEA